MVTEQDRITRDDLHWWRFVDWILKNGKQVEVLDDPTFDIHSEDGRILAGAKAAQAAKYRKAVQAKQLDRTRFFRENRLVPGRDHAAAIAELRTALVNLTAAVGRAASPLAVEALARQMDEHARTIERLEAEPAIPARWIEEPTGVAYRRQWSAAGDWEARAALLRKAGVRCFCEGTHKSGTLHMWSPPAQQQQATDGIDCREERVRRHFLELRRDKGLGPGFRYSPR